MCIVIAACSIPTTYLPDAGPPDTGEDSVSTDPEPYNGCRRYTASWGGNVLDADGLTWDTAFASVDDAVERAAEESPCQVWVASGVYNIFQSSRSDTVQMRSGVDILGGFVGGETHPSQRDPAVNLTVLDGRSAFDENKAVYHVVIGATDATLDGFTVRYGMADGDFPDSLGAGLLNFSAHPTISDCRFEHNSSKSGGGGAIDNRYSSPHVIDTVFSSNDGLVRNCWGSNPSFERCSFIDNLGGISSVDSSGVTVIDSLFFGTAWGAAISMSGPSCGDAGLVNTVFYRNGGSGGGAILAEDNCTVEVTNCTIVDNYAAEESGAAIRVKDGASAVVSNTVLWSNDPAALATSDEASLAVSYSIVEGGYEGEGNLDADPLVSDPDWFHFEPLPGSPCIDRADGNRAPQADMKGNARHDDHSVENTFDCEATDEACCEYADIGAVEFIP